MDAALKILAVDDNPSIRHSMHFIFAGPRYEVTDAPDGDDALARLEANSGAYDVIIVDQKMPNLTGVEVVTALRERGVQSRIIVLSAHITDEVRQTYEELGVQAIFEKPPDINQLRAAVDALPSG